jgi:hypothetical protein
MCDRSSPASSVKWAAILEDIVRTDKDGFTLLDPSALEAVASS